MVIKYPSNAPHPSPSAPVPTTQLGPHLTLCVDRFDRIMVEYVTAEGEISYRAPKVGELAAAKQLTWWASDANPLRNGRSVERADGLSVRGWLTGSLQGAYWIAVEVCDAEGEVLNVPSIIPRHADAAAHIEALLSLPVTPSLIPSTPRNGSRFLA